MIRKEENKRHKNNLKNRNGREEYRVGWEGGREGGKGGFFFVDV